YPHAPRRGEDRTLPPPAPTSTGGSSPPPASTVRPLVTLALAGDVHFMKVRGARWPSTPEPRSRPLPCCAEPMWPPISEAPKSSAIATLGPRGTGDPRRSPVQQLRSLQVEGAPDDLAAVGVAVDPPGAAGCST